jgi:hypothetical protein
VVSRGGQVGVAAVVAGLAGQAGQLGADVVAFGFQVGERAQVPFPHRLHGG